MDNFFKQFRENLDARPAPGFEERDWRSFEKKLGAPADKRRFAAGWWWLFLPLFAGSFAANGLLFREIKEFRQSHSIVEIHRDTVFLTKLIYETDTVFRTQLVHQTVFEKDAAKSVVEVSDLDDVKTGIARDPEGSGRPDTPRSQVSDMHDRSVQPDQNSRSTQPDPLNRIAENMPVKDLPTERVGSQTLTSALTSVAADSTATARMFLEKKEVRKTFFQQISGYRPTSFGAGILGGTVAPFGENTHWMPGPAVNLEALVGFTRQLRLQFRGGFSNPKFESNTVDPALGIPESEPPTDDYKLAAVDAEQPSIHVSVEMHWLFRPEKRWKPVIGIGLGAAWQQQFQASYDFVNQITGAEFIAEETVQAATSPARFGILSAGAERFISKKWSGTGRAAWQFPVGTGPKRPAAFELAAGLRYRF